MKYLKLFEVFNKAAYDREIKIATEKVLGSTINKFIEAILN